MIDTTIGFLEDRLAQIGAMLAFDHRAMHELRAVAAAIRSILECDLLVIIGASAITDRRDVVPTGIVVAGGVVEHLGMAVEPGSMLLSDRMPAGRVYTSCLSSERRAASDPRNSAASTSCCPASSRDRIDGGRPPPNGYGRAYRTAGRT